MFSIFNGIIDKLKNYKLKNVDVILNIQNIVVFGISLYSMYSCLNYYIVTGETTYFYKTDSLPITVNVSYIKPFDNLLWFIRIHAIVDIFFVRKIDITLHHLSIIGMCFYDWYNSVTEMHRFIFLYPLIKTEISSFFYILTQWLPKNTYAYNINSILFYATFCKFRIFDMYNELINGNAIGIIIDTYTHYNPLSGIFYISIYGLYIINLYWFFIMTKMLYKQLCKNTFIDTEIMSQYICSYIHYINIPLAGYIYSYNKREQNIFDMAGIVILSLSSYMYHYDIYERLYKNQITEYIVEKNINYTHFLNDSICIHGRCFLVIVTNYYNSPYFYPVTICCAIIQILFLYSCIINVLELKNIYDKHFLNTHYFFTFLPIGINTILLYFNNNAQEITPILFLNISILLLFIVNPFYKLTHVAFHILLIVQNMYICLANIS